MKTISLPVSFGEAVDKLTILEIKSSRINDGLDFINSEINAISTQLKNSLYDENLTSIFFYKNCLKIINLEIWNCQDEFRDLQDLSSKTILCEKIIELNDARFRVKKKIDSISDSRFREQKSYAKRKAFILGHLGMGDQISCSPIVRYLSCFYDEVKVVVKAVNYEAIKLFYRDDPTITFECVNTDQDISPAFGCSSEKFDKQTYGYSIFRLGLHSIDKEIKIENIPFNFYNELNIDCSKLFDFFYCEPSVDILQKMELLKDREYVLMHSKFSGGTLFTPKDLFENFKIDLDKTLVIDINENYYPSHHPFRELAEKFINLPISDYVILLKNASNIFLSDSALFCLALPIRLQSPTVYYRSRMKFDYSYVNEYRIRYLGNEDSSLFIPF